MLAEARRRLPAGVRLVEGDADHLPFPDASFAALTFTYLMRYVDDPARRCASSRGSSGPAGRSPGSSSACRRTRRPGALALLRRRRPPARRPADLAGLARGRRLPRAEHRAALGALPLERLLELWRAAGIAGRSLPAAEPRRRDRDLGRRPGERRGSSPPRSTPSSPGELARLRHGAAPAVHGLASQLRRDRRRARARTGTRAASAPRSWPSSSRSGSAPTRSTS